MKKFLSIVALIAAPFAANAADLPSTKSAPAPVVYAPAYSWTGVYVGLSGGYAGDKFVYPGSYTDPNPNNDVSGSASLTSSGFLGGAQLGYNYQFANGLVVGAEADYSFSTVKGEVSLNASTLGFGASASAGSKLEGLGTVRARLGYAWDRALLFATGGYAYGRVKSYADISINSSPIIDVSKSTSNNGWVLGAGLEYALTNNITFKTEYLYADLGKSNLFNGNIGNGIVNIDVKTKLNIVRAGINYKF